MNLLSRRAAARAGICAIALATAGLFATPAYAADDADLGVELAGTTVALGSSGKFSSVTVTNHGPGVVSGLVVRFDLSGLVDSQVVADTEDCTDEGSDVWACPVPDDSAPAATASVKFGEFLDLADTAVAGTAGTLKVSVSHAGTDGTEGNNEDSAEIVVTAKDGPDLFVTARDVHDKLKLDADGIPVFDDDGNLVYDGPLTAGSVSVVEYVVRNQGSAPASGFTSTIALPEHVTFADLNDDLPCVETDARHAECTWPLPTVPGVDDTDPNDDDTSAWLVVAVIQVDAGVTAPVTLPDGAITATPIVDAPELGARSRTGVARFVTPLTEDEVDVDPTDNSDTFAVFVSAGSGSGGSLPITGVQAGLIGGAGLAVLIAGGVLVLLARRRRVVLVTPTE